MINKLFGKLGLINMITVTDDNTAVITLSEIDWEILFIFLQNGDTALHIAAAMGRRKLTRVLLESNCSRTVRNKVIKAEPIQIISAFCFLEVNSHVWWQNIDIEGQF